MNVFAYFLHHLFILVKFLNTAVMKNYMLQHKRDLLNLIAVVLSVVTISYAWSGWSQHLAEGKITKACEILYPIGNVLTADTPYGDSSPSISNSELAHLEEAAILASDAAMNNSRYQFFRDEVLLFGMNLDHLTSVQAETLHSPYDLYTYGIDPVCSNQMYVGENPGL